jgi:radical SAM protein with 4Fe4S-binding SPASM domain
MDDIHLNVAQRSGHYYANADSDAFVPEPDAARQVMRLYRRRKGAARSPRQLLENAYLKRLDRFLQTGRTPEPCHALRASCFIDPWGVVYPCITYSRPMGRLRDTGMRLDPIWNGAGTRAVQREIWDGQCPQCWTACEAYQSILGNTLAVRRRMPEAAPIGGPAVSPAPEVPR